MAFIDKHPFQLNDDNIERLNDQVTVFMTKTQIMNAYRNEPVTFRGVDLKQVKTDGSKNLVRRCSKNID